MTRRESREVAFMVIFEKMFQSELTLDEFFEMAAETELFKAGTFAKGLANGVFENVEKIDEIISENLVSWSLSRISKTSRAVLRLAVYELKFTDVPVGVAINEALEICKKYSTEADASFVNGVLASVSKNA